MRHRDASVKKPIAAILGILALGLVVLDLPASTPSAAAATSAAGHSPGYWLVGNNGAVYQFGTSNFGDMRNVRLAQPVVGGAPTGDGLGYWLVASDGGIFSFGDAHFHGSTGGIRLNRPIVAMAADPATAGYWMVASDGGIFAFGAGFYGSTGGIRLNQPVVGMAPTPDGRGYWLVASDGGIFAFGDARFYGSTGGIRLDKPVVGMAATPDGRGYWLVASDGGIFAFGDARFYGSTGGIRLNAPIVGMNAIPGGNGYWLAASDGGVFSFGHAPFEGSASTNGSPPIVAMMSTAYGYPLPPGSTGYDVSKYNCPPYRNLPSPRTFAMVEISGAINNYYNPCYRTEASWAGRNMSSYIFMNPLPSPAPSESLSGPAGTCNGRVTCEAFNFGFYWAAHWVNYSRSIGVNPSLWWLDVEFEGGWGLTPADYPANSNVIAGAVAGLRATGVTPGLYATSYQWGQITGNQVYFPNIPLWEAGAVSLNDPGDPESATKVCAGSVPDHKPFAGGSIVVVQYGYAPGGGETQSTDPDYACR